MLRPLVIALAVLAVAAPAAAAHDAEIIATDNTSIITDPKDPRLKDRLEDFARGRARIEHGKLLITGTPEDDTLRLRYARHLEIDFGDDGVIDFETRRRPLRIDLGDGITIDAPDAWEVHTDLGGADGDLDRAVVHDSDDGNQTSVSFFSGRVNVLAGAWTTFAGTEPTDRLRVNGNGGNDIRSASTDAMALTLDGGGESDVILGGPGRDTLIGGDDFDDIKGGRGDDAAYMGSDFDRFSWAPGDGSDTIDGGPSRDSLFFAGSADAETFELEGARFTRDVGASVMALEDVEVVDAVAGGGADTFRVGRSDVAELNASLAPGGGAADPDRIEIAGTEGDDDVTVTGSKVVFGSATVTGLPVKLGISFAQIGFDTLVVDTLGGDDSVDTSGLAPDVIALDIK